MRLRKLTSFTKDENGQFAIMGALMTVPLVMAVGVAVDYSRMTLARAEMQTAVDAAALAAVSTNSKSYKDGGLFKGFWTESAAKEEARDWFVANYGNTFGYPVDDADVDIKRVGTELTATLEVRVLVPATFLAIVGQSPSPISVTATARSTLQPYADVYVLADNTPSMAIGATPSDISAMQNLVGCQFACHDLSHENNNNSTSDYQKVRNANITLRLDSTAEALSSLISKMQTKTEMTSQFRVSAYHFGTMIEAQQVTNFVPQTSNLTQAATNAKTLPLMTVPSAGYNNQMATDLNKIFGQMVSVVGTSGTGLTTSSRVKTLLVVTDGVNTTLNPPSCPLPLNYQGQCQSPINPDWCSAIKNNGVRIAVLYTTYYPLNDSWYREYIEPIMPQVPTALQNCASPGMYAEVQPHQGISEALELLFFKTVAAPRLTN